MAIEFRIIRVSNESDEAKALRAQYYALRKRAFEAKWDANFYPDGPDNFDFKPDTAYGLLVDVEKGNVLEKDKITVLAGARALFHPRGSDVETPMETNHANFHISKLLPQAHLPKICYCELSGIVADPDPKYLDSHLGTQVTEHTLHALRAGLISSNGQKADVVISSASNLGLGPIVRAANTLDIPGIIRRDLVQQEENPQFSTKLWPVVLKLRSTHFAQHLVTEKMVESGAKGDSLASLKGQPSAAYR